MDASIIKITKECYFFPGLYVIKMIALHKSKNIKFKNKYMHVIYDFFFINHYK